MSEEEKSIIDFNKDNIEDQLTELNKILNSKSKHIKFLIMYKDYIEMLGIFKIDIKVEILEYCFQQVVSFEGKNYLPIEYITETLKYHIFDKLCKKVGLDQL